MMKKVVKILLLLLLPLWAVAQDLDGKPVPGVAEQTNELDDIVIVGYGTVRKRDLTGAISSVRSADIVTVPTYNAVDAIQGKVAGMDIVQSSGRAGAGVEIRVRGNRSIMGSTENADRNKPLFIIDGVGGGSYDDLNPNDIESIEVLKDASSTAIYGSQGANGVVLITTKRGIKGQTRVSYDGFYGINGLASYPQPRMGESYLQFRRDIWRSQNSWESAEGKDHLIFTDQLQEEAMKNSVNWVEEMQRNARQQSHSVSVRSGTERTRTFMSLNYFEQEGTVKFNDAQRITARLNLDQTINKWAKAGMSTQYTYWDVNNRRESILKNALQQQPYGFPYDENGKVNMFPFGNDKRTVLLDEWAAENGIKNVNNEKKNQLTISAYFEFSPIEGLTFTSRAGANINHRRTGIYQDSVSWDVQDARGGGPNAMEYNTNVGQSITWENILTYKKTIADIHALTLTGITSTSKSISESSTIKSRDQLNRDYLFYKIQAGKHENLSATTNYTGTAMNSVAGRVEYGLMDKYLFTASIRWDGASRLAEGNKWDYFPAASAAWRISDEEFMQQVSQVNDMKLRVSYGVTGNSGIDAYGTQSGAEILTDNFSFGEERATLYGFKYIIGNSALGWEKSASLDVGLDLSLFNSRVSLTMDYYNTDTYDILMLRRIATTSGGQKKEPFQTYQNVASTNNKGVEVTLNTVNVDKAGFRWTSTLTFAKNWEKIVSLFDDLHEIIEGNKVMMVGYPIKSLWHFKKVGVWQVGETPHTGYETGDMKFEDVDKDGAINDNDKQLLGSETPKWIGGFSNTFSYKGVDLTVALTARWGQTIKAEFLGRYNSQQGNGVGADYFDYWMPENPTNDFPRPGKQPHFNGEPLCYVDGSYLKLRTISFGYTLPRKYAQMLKLEKLRVYATGNNIATYANSHLIKYYDPERGGSESSPLSKQFVLGLNLEF